MLQEFFGMPTVHSTLCWECSTENADKSEWFFLLFCLTWTSVFCSVIPPPFLLSLLPFSFSSNITLSTLNDVLLPMVMLNYLDLGKRFDKVEAVWKWVTEDGWWATIYCPKECLIYSIQKACKVQNYSHFTGRKGTSESVSLMVPSIFVSKQTQVCGKVMLVTYIPYTFSRVGVMRAVLQWHINHLFHHNVASYWFCMRSWGAERKTLGRQAFVPSSGSFWAPACIWRLPKLDL